MADWDDVRAAALALPDTAEASSYGSPAWKVHGALFVWDRPLRPADRAAIGSDDTGPVLGVRVADEGVKHALIADDPSVYFTIPHFDGYASVLVRLERIDPAELTELIVEAWLLRAPRRLARDYLDGRA